MTSEVRPAWMDVFRHNRPEPAEPVSITPIAAGDGTPSYARTALEQEVGRVRAAAKGERNATLNRATFAVAQLVASGVLDYTTAHDNLLAAALAAGLPRTEAERTIGSGFRGGARKPRDLSGVRELAAPDVQEVTSLTPTLQPPEPATAALAGQSAPEFTAGNPEPPGESEGRPRTSWWAQPIELLAARYDAEPGPDIGIRTDGRGLFYRGKVNGLLGESESGKSWLSLHACHQVAASGERALILDFEDTARSARERLALLGAVGEAMTRIAYASPDQILDALASEDLTEFLHDWRPTVIVVDGLNAAMTLLGLDINSNTDATMFHVRLLKPLAASGAAVITVDHVPKNPEQRGKGGIGAQAKRAMMSGCAIRVEVAEPFGRGSDGRLKLYVDKDRPGHVRGHSGGGKYAGTFIIESHPNGIRAEIQAPDEGPSTWRPTGVMESISNILGAQPLSKNAIETMINGRRETIREALRHLIEDGHVRVEHGPRGAVLHHLVTRFGSTVEEVSTDAL